MPDRRFFLKQLIFSAVGGFCLIIRGFFSLDKVWGAVRQILPQGTRPDTLINENPALLDTRNLDIQPLEHFGTMGLSDQKTDPKKWRLVCTGGTRRELRLTYDEIRNLPALEKPVLLICPGFFANYGRWRGFSLSELGKRAGIKKGVNSVTISGPAGPYEKTGRFPLKDIESEKVFLAYQVNGEALPVKHGFPLRLVAEDYYGYEWIKYVDTIRFEKIEPPS